MKKIKNIWLLCLFFFILNTCCETVFATVYTSNGGGGGNWNNAATWNPSGVPGSGDDVSILSGDLVILTANTSCRNITIAGFQSCLLCLCGCPNSELRLGSYTLTVGGSFTNNATFTANTGTIIFNGNIAQTIGGTSAISFYGLTINTTNTVALASNVSITNVLTMTAGTFNASTFNLNGAGGITTTGGNLQLAILATTVPQLTGAYNLTGGTITLNGAGNQTIRGGKTYYSLFIDGNAGTKTLGGAITVNSDLTINSSTLDVSASNYAITLGGNWTNNATFTAQGGKVILNGGGAQAIGGSAVNPFHNVDVNKAGGTLTLNQNLITDNSGVLNLITGPIAINKFTITINNGATTAITRTSGYLISEDNSLTGGKANNSSYVTWAIGVNTGSHVFPFGITAAAYIPFTYNLTSGNAGNVTVSTYHTASNNTPLPIPVTSMGDTTNSGADDSPYVVDRFWGISSSGGTADITFTYDNRSVAGDDVNSLSGGVNGSDGKGLRAQQWNNGTSKWSRFYNPAQTFNVGASTVLIPSFSGALNNNSPWTLALHVSPLPISLLNFRVTLNRLNQAEISWQTAQEVNNQTFIIERSANGSLFSTLSEQIGAGNSTSVRNYSFIDSIPLEGISYYRLKQIDFDGNYSYGPVLALSNTHVIGQLKVYPNPAGTQINMEFNSRSAKPVYITFYDRIGRIVMKQRLDVAKGFNSYAFDLTTLISGTYQFLITSIVEGENLQYQGEFVKD